MGVEAFLVMRGTVLRNTGSTRDAQNAVVENWSTAASNVPCRVQGMEGKEIQRYKQVAEISHLGYFGVSVDLTEKDRLRVGTVTYGVEFVNRNPGGETGDHVVAGLREVRS